MNGCNGSKHILSPLVLPALSAALVQAAVVDAAFVDIVDAAVRSETGAC